MTIPPRLFAGVRAKAMKTALTLAPVALLSLAAPAGSQSLPEAEEATTLKMTPPTTRWAFIRGSYGMNGTRVFDGDTGKMKGTVDTSSRSDMAIDPAGKFYYVAESLWSEGDRGTRQDIVTIYDSVTQERLGKIAIPGRLIVGNRKQNFVLSYDGSLGFVYNMQPSSSVNVVDLVKRKFVRTIELPGCASLFPAPGKAFSALCSDGSLATVSLAGAKPVITHSAPFFSATGDPIFDNGIVDKAKGEATFLTYTGLIYQVKLGATPEIGTPWSLQQAAGLRPGDTAPLDVNWFPGGRQPMALHRPSGTLYVLMHVGEYWTQKEPGTEIWKIDLATHKVLKRHPLKDEVSNIEVTQDDKSLIFVNEGKGKTWILDSETFEEKRNIEHAGGGVIAVIDPS
jgi:methylamine dehydrogenase heavy chain